MKRFSPSKKAPGRAGRENACISGAGSRPGQRKGVYRHGTGIKGRCISVGVRSEGHYRPGEPGALSAGREYSGYLPNHRGRLFQYGAHCGYYGLRLRRAGRRSGRAGGKAGGADPHSEKRNFRSHAPNLTGRTRYAAHH